MDNKAVFAKNLNKLMKENGKTRKDVCNALGFSYFTFSDWCKGKKYPRMDKVEILASYFGVLKSDLIEEKPDVSPPRSDVSEELNMILAHLRDTEREMTVDGNLLDPETKALLIASLENSLKMAQAMNSRNRGGEN